MIGKLTEFCKYLDIFCVLYTGGLTQHEISILCHSISQLNLLRFSENKWEDEVREQLCNKPKNSHKYIFHCIIFTDMFRSLLHHTRIQRVLYILYIHTYAYIVCVLV